MIATQNDFLIAANGTLVAPLLPVQITSREQALRTAAWIACLGEMLPSEGDDRPSFDDVLAAVQNT